MRIHPWIAALSSVLMLMAAGETSAQSRKHSPEGMSFDEAVAGRAHLSSEVPGGLGLSVRGQSSPYGYGYGTGQPGSFQPAYGTNNPAALWPPQAPSSYQPHPAISPYFPPNISRDATYNDRGLWFRELMHRQRDYVFTLEYLSTGYRDPGNHTIGERPLPVRLTDNSLQGFIIDNFGLGGTAEFGPGEFEADQRVIVGPGVLPYASLLAADGDDALTLGVDSFAFPVRTLDLINSPVEADGIRSRWGFFNEDGTGMLLTGWYGGLGQDTFRVGYDNWNGIPLSAELILANAAGEVPVFPRNGAVPLEFAEGIEVGLVTDDGEGAFEFDITGAAQKFDVLYQVDVETRAFGGAINVYHEPIFKRKWVSVRPTVAARYLYVDDRFRFRGIDSGLHYDPDDVEEPTFRPGDAFIPTDVNGVPIDLFFEAILQSEVDSHLAGPEVGFRYDFGQSKDFSIWGQSTVALLANHERVKITGKNIGDPLLWFLITEGATGVGENFADPDVDSTFTDSDTHTHASPMFEQSVFVKANVLKFVPLINQVHFLEQAQFQAGYTYTIIGEMARAGDSIKWKAFPDTPFVDIDYRTWSMHNWSFGVHWTY